MPNSPGLMLISIVVSALKMGNMAMAYSYMIIVASSGLACRHITGVRGTITNGPGTPFRCHRLANRSGSLLNKTAEKAMELMLSLDAKAESKSEASYGDRRGRHR